MNQEELDHEDSLQNPIPEKRFDSGPIVFGPDSAELEKKDIPSDPSVLDYLTSPIETVNEFIVEPIEQKISDTRDWVDEKYVDFKDFWWGEPSFAKEGVSTPVFDFPEQENFDTPIPEDPDWNHLFGLDTTQESEPELDR